MLCFAGYDCLLKLTYNSRFFYIITVGGPLDRSCQLEGTLDLVEHRKLELQRQLEQVERLSQGLKAGIEEIEGQDPTHPIITLPPPPIDQEQQNKPTSSCPGTPVHTGKFDTPNLYESPTVVTEGDNGVELSHSPVTPGRDASSPTDIGSPFTIDNADINGRYARLSAAEDGLLSLYQKIEDNEPPSIVEVGCSSFLFGRMCASEDDDDGMRRLIGLSFDESESSNEIPPPPALPPSIAATPSMVTGSSSSSAQRPLSSPHRTPSFDTIDFRTGMSGHRALGSTRAADPRAVPRGRVRMMSEHCGISRIRGRKATKASNKITKGAA